MPIYEYLCRDCGQRFEAIVNGARKAACPHCDSRRLEQQLSVFAVGASAPKSRAAAGPCGSCGDSRGPGACSLD